MDTKKRKLFTLLAMAGILSIGVISIRFFLLRNTTRLNERVTWRYLTGDTSALTICTSYYHVFSWKDSFLRVLGERVLSERMSYQLSDGRLYDVGAYIHTPGQEPKYQGAYIFTARNVLDLVEKTGIRLIGNDQIAYADGGTNFILSVNESKSRAVLSCAEGLWEKSRIQEYGAFCLSEQVADSPSSSTFIVPSDAYQEVKLDHEDGWYAKGITGARGLWGCIILTADNADYIFCFSSGDALIDKAYLNRFVDQLSVFDP